MNWGPVQVIVRGAYAYYLEQYRKFFPRENMLVLNSDELKVEPWKTVIKTQQFFDVQVTVTEKNFIKNETTGQFCFVGELSRLDKSNGYMVIIPFITYWSLWGPVSADGLTA